MREQPPLARAGDEQGRLIGRHSLTSGRIRVILFTLSWYEMFSGGSGSRKVSLTCDEQQGATSPVATKKSVE